MILIRVRKCIAKTSGSGVLQGKAEAGAKALGWSVPGELHSQQEGQCRRLVKSGGEQTRAGGASELGRDLEVYPEHESVMHTENLSHILVFSARWPPRWPFLLFPVVRALDTPQA